MADLARYRRDLRLLMASQQSLPLSSKIETKILPSRDDVRVVSAPLFFPHFLEFPAEVRLKIWRHCLPGPRVLEIDYEEHSKCFRSKYPPPIALHICRESRAEALKHYELSFRGKSSSGHVYFDYSKDTLHFQHSGLFSIFSNEETLRVIGNGFARVKCMSFCLQRSGTLSMPYLPDFRAFHSLEEIILLVSPGGCDGPDRVFVDPSAVTLSPSSSFNAIEFLPTDGNNFARLWPDPDFQDFSVPKISIMSYISGYYRVC